MTTRAKTKGLILTDCVGTPSTVFLYQMAFYLSSNSFKWWLKKVPKEGVDKAYQAQL